MLVNPSNFNCLNFQVSLLHNLRIVGTILNFNILLETEIIYSYKDITIFLFKRKNTLIKKHTKNHLLERLNCNEANLE